MDFQAFTLIQDGLAEELQKQGFHGPEPLEFEKGTAVSYATEEVAYCLRYDNSAQRFELCSALISPSGEVGDWRSLSLWLFDEKEGDRRDAESILNDFLDVVRGPKRVAVVQQKRKRGKDDERNVDPMFFINRLAGLFPELKNDLNEERILYGQVRYVTFVKQKVSPLCEELAAKNPDSDLCKKLCALLDDMYKNGDLNVRSIVTCSLLNTMSDGAFASLQDRLGEELQKDIKHTRKLKDKKIKPEKPKKEKKKVQARLGG
ncbi:MAG: hypothetical protein J1E06_04290 [Acutalibacter sp.]|nr:hypothetical protein [Acutalibacter sp.]